MTQLLLAWREGDEAALARLTPLVHAELQRIARGCMRGQPADHTLQALAELDERQSRVVELRFFGGLSVAETATVLGVSNETVMRDWKVARAWLMREMKVRTTT